MGIVQAFLLANEFALAKHVLRNFAVGKKECLVLRFANNDDKLRTGMINYKIFDLIGGFGERKVETPIIITDKCML